MPRKKERQYQVKPMAPEIKDRFKNLMATPVRKIPPVVKSVGGFDLVSKNVNQLWRWDTLEDVKL